MGGSGSAVVGPSSSSYSSSSAAAAAAKSNNNNSNSDSSDNPRSGIAKVAPAVVSEMHLDAQADGPPDFDDYDDYEDDEDYNEAYANASQNGGVNAGVRSTWSSTGYFYYVQFCQGQVAAVLADLQGLFGWVLGGSRAGSFKGLQQPAETRLRAVLERQDAAPVAIRST